MAIFHGKVAIAVVIIHRYLLNVDFSKYVNDTFYALPQVKTLPWI